MEQPWGADHLAGNYGTYWSGAGCRDISMVMSYTAVVAHAALLAEQLRTLAATPDAAIRVWTRNVADGAITAHAVPVCDERVISLDDMALFIDNGVVEKMHRLRESHLPNETGGILLGYHDLNVNAIVVVDAFPAPLDSLSGPASFERGVLGVSDAAPSALSTFAALSRQIMILSGEPVPAFPASPAEEGGQGTASSNPMSSPAAARAPKLARISSSSSFLRECPALT